VRMVGAGGGPRGEETAAIKRAGRPDTAGADGMSGWVASWYLWPGRAFAFLIVWNIKA
jgi:hypothetical protein